MLEPATLAEVVDSRFKASDLKLLLKQKGLKASGRKDELVERLIEHDPQSMHEATKGVVLYRCTAEAMRITEHYFQCERIKREVAEKETLALLTRNEFEQAVRLVADYEASQVFPSGVSSLEVLRLIFRKTPVILSGMAEDRLSDLRRAAGMMQLWGGTEARRWLPETFETGIHLDAEALLGCSSFTLPTSEISSDTDRLRSRQLKFSLPRVTPAQNAESSEERSTHSGSCPELPYAKCRSDLGCRCTTVADV